METFVTFCRAHRRTIFAIVFLSAFSISISYAIPPTSPYQSGETLDPTCAPGETNCTVDGNSLPSLADGSVVFSGGGNLSEDNANFFWDNTNKRLGLGTSTPIYSLDIAGQKMGLNGRQILYLPDQTQFSSTLIIGNGGANLANTPSTTEGQNNTFVGINSGLRTTTGQKNTAVGAHSLINNTTGSRNTAVGEQALGANTAGQYNSAFGYFALVDNTTGQYNTASGYQSLQKNTTGEFNAAFGSRALLLNTIGWNNTALGPDSLSYNTTGGENTAIGSEASWKGTTGSENIAIGFRSLLLNETGAQNVIVGSYAAAGIVGGSNVVGNSILGHAAGKNLLTGADYNTLIGYKAGDNITTGARNIIIGYDIDAVSITASDQLNIGNTIYGDLVTKQVRIPSLVTLNSAPSTTGTTRMVVSDENGSLSFANIPSSGGGGSVTSITAGSGLSGGTITTSGTIALDSNSIASLSKADSALQPGDVVSSQWVTSGSNISYTLGNVGIGTASPSYTLDVAGEKIGLNDIQAIYIPNQTNFRDSLIIGNGGGNLTNNSASEGYENTYIGINSGRDSTTGRGNTGLGANALIKNTTGTYNTALGSSALFSNTVGTDNVAIGRSALYNNTTGLRNVAIGKDSLRDLNTGQENVAIGNSSLMISTASFNTAVGASTLRANTTGTYNVAVGRRALTFNTIGVGNVGLGTNALEFNTEGSGNVATGNEALFLNTNASSNTATGDKALRNNSTGTENAVFGTQAGLGMASGTYPNEVALSNISGNSLFGFRSGYSLITGADYNTLIGYKAGDNITTGARNIIIGYDIDAVSITASDQLNIGNTIYGDMSTNKRVGIGMNPTVHNLEVSGTGYFTNGTTSCTIDPAGGGTCSSDINLKTNIKLLGTNEDYDRGYYTTLSPKGSVLENLLALKPVEYSWTNKDLGENRHIGFIAQEVEIFFPDLVTTDKITGYKSLNYAGLTPVLTRAIQEMDLKITGINDMTKSNSWRDAIARWLASADNRVESIFTKRVQTEKICNSDGRCANVDDLLDLLNKESSIPNTTQSQSIEEVTQVNDEKNDEANISEESIAEPVENVQEEPKEEATSTEPGEESSSTDETVTEPSEEIYPTDETTAVAPTAPTTETEPSDQ